MKKMATAAALVPFLGMTQALLMMTSSELSLFINRELVSGPKPFKYRYKTVLLKLPKFYGWIAF